MVNAHFSTTARRGGVRRRRAGRGSLAQPRWMRRSRRGAGRPQHFPARGRASRAAPPSSTSADLVRPRPAPVAVVMLLRHPRGANRLDQQRQLAPRHGQNLMGRAAPRDHAPVLEFMPDINGFIDRGQQVVDGPRRQRQDPYLVVEHARPPTTPRRSARSHPARAAVVARLSEDEHLLDHAGAPARGPVHRVQRLQPPRRPAHRSRPTPTPPTPSPSCSAAPAGVPGQVVTITTRLRRVIPPDRSRAGASLGSRLVPAGRRRRPPCQASSSSLVRPRGRCRACPVLVPGEGHSFWCGRPRSAQARRSFQAPPPPPSQSRFRK